MQKNLIKQILVGLVLSIGVAVCSAAETSPLPEDQIKEFTLDNGWKFIVMPRHDTPVLSFFTMANVGSCQEVKGITGTAHLLEHLAFKGTPNIGTTDYAKEKPTLEAVDKAYQLLIAEQKKGTNANPETLKKLTESFVQSQQDAGQYVVQNEFSAAIDRFGGQGLNASTSTDYTVYFFSLPSNAAELWFFLESDRFYEPVFREFYKERNVVNEERRMSVESNPMRMAMEDFLAAAFKAHPYGEPVIGHRSDIQNLTPDEVMGFFKSHYVPSSMVSAIVGDITLERAQELAKAYFGRIQIGRAHV